MKKQNVRQNAGQTTRMENKSVSSKVTIRNSTTLIERSETGKEKQKPETNGISWKRECPYMFPNRSKMR